MTSQASRIGVYLDGVRNDPASYIDGVRNGPAFTKLIAPRLSDTYLYPDGPSVLHYDALHSCIYEDEATVLPDDLASTHGKGGRSAVRVEGAAPPVVEDNSVDAPG